jgi:hypothetical protein
LLREGRRLRNAPWNLLGFAFMFLITFNLREIQKPAGASLC